MKKIKQQSSHLIRMVALLALLLVGINASWAQTIISTFSMPTENPTPAYGDAYILDDEGGVKYYAQGLIDDKGNYVSRVVDGQTYRKLQDNDIEKAHIKLLFAAGTIKAGDVLSITCVQVYGTNPEEVGYEMGVSGTNVSGNYEGSPITLTHTITASEIVDNGDGNEYILIGRMDWKQSAYGTITVTRPAGYVINWTPGDIPTGCDAWYTISGDETEYRCSLSGVQEGKSITLRATDAENAHKIIDYWNVGGTKYYNDAANRTLNSSQWKTDVADNVLTLQPSFCDAYTMTAVPGTGCSSVSLKNSENSTDLNGVKLKSGDRPSITLTAVGSSGYDTFDGWYKGDSKVSPSNPYSYGKFDPADKTADLVITARFKSTTHPAVTCTNNIIDLSKITAHGDLTSNYNEGKISATISKVNGEYSNYLMLEFDTPQDLSQVQTITINGGISFGDIPFKDGEKLNDEGTDKKSYWPSQTFSDGKTIITLGCNPNYNSIKSVQLRTHNSTESFVINSITLEYGGDHVKSTPVLNNGTSADMSIIVGEPLTLSATNGYWREFEDAECTINKTGNIPDDRWNPKAPFDGETLPLLDEGVHYFGIKDASNCAAFGVRHSSELVKVKVTVKPTISTIEVNGTTRQYDVYAPESISGEVGVVISLHGANNDYDNGRVDFNDIADDNKEINGKKFVVVYPRGLKHQEIWGGARSWESFDEASSNDTEFFKAIVKKINDDDNGLTVNMSRIYLAGFSNGGMMAYKAAHKDGDFYAACASVGGFPVNESHLWHAGSRPVPFVHIHGEKDNVVRINEDSEHPEDAVYDKTAIIHNMVYRNGAQFNPNGTIKQDNSLVTWTKKDDIDVVTKDCHAAETGGAAYYFYEIKGMWHEASKDWDGDGKDDVAKTMWAFFNATNITKEIDPTLKFRTYDTNSFWDFAESLGGFEKGNGDNPKKVLSYGGYSKTNDNKNVYHSLQFDGKTNGAPHFLKLNVQTVDVGGAQNENTENYFLVKLTKTGSSIPVFAKRYQAGRGTKDLYINFAALPGLNEYKLEVTRSNTNFTVQINGVEFHTGKCQDYKVGGDNEHPIYADENPVFFFDVNKTLEDAEMKAIYQPVYDASYFDIAKEYLPIADINTTNGTIVGDIRLVKNGEIVGTIPSTVIAKNVWDENNQATISSSTLFNLAHSGKDGEVTDHKINNAYIYIPDGGTITYPVDREKGINISANGRAMMPEYLNGTRGDFPDKGVIAIKVQGTVDFFLLASSKYTTDANRRTLKVYYTNDQMNNEVKELTEWWFYGTRCEDYSQNFGNLPPLSVNVRLPQLGKDGTCTLFVTYEGNGTLRNGNTFTHDAADNDAVWIKGFVIKRPDLKVTIGRTDRKYEGQRYTVGSDNQNNTFLTHFGENRPYVWNFENVGFNNTKTEDLNGKKYNMKDGRTYVCGNNTDSEGKMTDIDHLLLFSNAASTNSEDKVQFDGRVAGQEHIEFLRASQYNIPEATNNRKIWDPIQSNGLKVNVTGSGWFKIKCAAPNGPVKMKVYSSTNYGTQYINLLREFEVNTKDMPNAETNWQEYTVYLKGHVNRDGNNGFWDGTIDGPGQIKNAEEILRMSLYVVFDEMQATANYDEGHPQLNIHELSWLNEEPADYVFQREEDPKLLTEWQKIKRDLDGNGEVDDDEVVVWWKAANDDDSKYEVLKENGQNAYNRLGQFTSNIAGGKGMKSPGSYASTSVPSDVDPYDAYWDIAAPANCKAHTEKAYGGNKVIDNDSSPQYSNIKEDGKSVNTEFDLPVSGSFVRICAMQNTYVAAHVLPGASGAKIYVLDETGNPIKSSNDGSDDAKSRGYIATMTNVSDNDGNKITSDATVRVDFVANAGKEYFICADGTSVSLARLEVHDWRYNPTKSSSVLALQDGQNNSTAITTAYDTKEFYRNATLKRKPDSKKWFSLVLPFSLNEKKFKEVFGDDAECLHFTDVDTENNTVKLTHHYYNMVVAGRPVFVWTSKDFSAKNVIEMNDVTLQAREVRNIPTAKGFEFFASYDNSTMVRNDLYMNNANAVNYLNIDNTTYPGMRAFIKSPAGYDPSKGSNALNTQISAKAVFLSFDDSDPEFTTGIEELITSEFGENAVIVSKSTKVYDLKGRVVSTGADISNIPAGIYIVNGKKFVVK